MDRWATVKRLYQTALERQSNERAAFLDVACAGDVALRHEVESGGDFVAFRRTQLMRAM